MKKKTILSRLAALCLVTAMLAGCGKTAETPVETLPAETEIAEETVGETETQVETGYIPDNEEEGGYIPETEIPTEEESEIPTEPEPEPEQILGEDYQLDVDTIALEIGTDESNLTVVWEHTYPEGEVIRLWKTEEPDVYVDFLVH